jgi:TonB family protein
VSDADTSPRIASMFTAVRRRVLPALIRDEYRIARAAIDRKELKVAEPHLTLASRLIAEVTSMGAADDTLSDLSLVIDGFLGLSRAAVEPPPQPAAPTSGPPAATAAAATPSVGNIAVANTAANAGAGGAPPAPAAAKPQVYAGPATANLTPPVTIRQQSPELPRNVAALMIGSSGRSLILSVLIDERGDVEDVSILQPLQQAYDALVARTARQWKYRPATLDGVPVKYRKAVTVEFVDR